MMMEKLEIFIFDILQLREKMWKVLGLTLGLFLFSVMLIPLGGVLAKMLPGKDSNTFNIYIDLYCNIMTKCRCMSLKYLSRSSLT